MSWSVECANWFTGSVKGLVDCTGPLVVCRINSLNSKLVGWLAEWAY